MKLSFQVIPYTLKFKFTAGTSRGSFTQKETWFIKATDDSGQTKGWGEVGPLKGLSIDYDPKLGIQIQSFIDQFDGVEIPSDQDEILTLVSRIVPEAYPSIKFGLETVLLHAISEKPFRLFDSEFASGKQRIPINGLVWMGDEAFMQQQIEEKLKSGFSTIKMKIGAIDFLKELKLLESIRSNYSSHEITLRVDANGAFDETNVRERLLDLASLEIHSIEQPVKPKQWDLISSICQEGLLPIALDEELIGVNTLAERIEMLDTIKPQYIILKPTLVGGIKACKEWIALAEERNIGWWMTSMLESNIGLNAIAQFTASYDGLLPQGLGTGQLYHNNIDSPLVIRRGEILYDKKTQDWDLSALN